MRAQRNEVVAIEAMKEARDGRDADARRLAVIERHRAAAEAARARQRITFYTLVVLVAIDVVLWVPIIAELVA